MYLYRSTFSPTRRKRTTSTDTDESSNYANFIHPDVVVLPDLITELPPSASTSANTVALQIPFYVKLPRQVTKSPNRATNYVVPKATLKHIVKQDKEVIGAVVRNSVSPSLTDQLLDGWKIVATVCLAVISVSLAVGILVATGFAVFKFKQSQM